MRMGTIQVWSMCLNPRNLYTRGISGLLLASLCLASAAADPQELATRLCSSCHGENGNSVAPNFPKLAGLQASYLEKQLLDFLEERRKNPVMQPFLSQIGTDDVAGLARFYAQQKPAAPTSVSAKSVAAGAKIYEDGNTKTGLPACVGCHQPEAEGNERFPRLAGQHAAYTAQQMHDFKSGARSNDKGKVMRAVAERMTKQDIKAVSDYLASLP